jgi:predicted permease
MILGFVAGKYLHVERKTIGALLLYIFIPVVYFAAVATTPLTASTLSLPILFFCLCSVIATLFLFLGKFVWKDAIKNICAQACGGGNYAYFAIPVALIIFGPKSTGLIVLSGLGFVLYENTVGFYIAARGNNSVQNSFKQLEKLPALWATVLGLIFNVMHLQLGQSILDQTTNFRGGFTVLGMMLVGLGLSSIKLKGFKFDFAYIAMTFLAKFIVWPTLMLTIIFLDSTYFHFYNDGLHKIMILMSIIPLAANTIVYAITLKINPENVAVGVLCSTLFALIFIPLIIVNFLH